MTEQPASSTGVSPKRRSLRRRWFRAVRNAVVGWLGPVLLKLYCGTLRVRWVTTEHVSALPWLKLTPCIATFWHQRMLLLLHAYRGSGIVVLVSEHGDGEMVARVCQRLGFGLVRGSSTRGGMRAARAMGRLLGDEKTVAITPDGPRGPAHVFREGAVFLASRRGLPILPMTTAFKSAWSAPTWDGFLLPRPWTRALVMSGDPLHVPPDLTREEVEMYRLEAERRLRELTQKADEHFEELFASGTKRRHLKVTPWMAAPLDAALRFRRDGSIIKPPTGEEARGDGAAPPGSEDEGQ